MDSDNSYSREVDRAFERLATAEGYLTTARRSIQRAPARSPLHRALREQAAQAAADALTHVQAATRGLVELERALTGE